MNNNFVTSSFQQQNNQTIAELRAAGFNVVEKNGKTLVQLGDKSYVVDLSQNIWEIMNEINEFKSQNDNNLFREWRDKYITQAEKHENIAKEADKRENLYREVIKQLKSERNSILSEYRVQNEKDINDSEKRQEAIKISEDIHVNVRQKIRASMEAFSNYLSAFCDYCSAMKFGG